MLDVLLMVIIGGIGTLYGGLIGAAFLLTARTLLPDLKGWAAALWPGSEIAQRLAERWLLYFWHPVHPDRLLLPEGRARHPARAAGGAARPRWGG